MKARIIADVTYQGGAERSFEALASNFDIVDEGYDFNLVGNVTQYNYTLIRELQDKPVIKIVHDVWPHADRELRAWLLQNSALLVFKSPAQMEYMQWRYHIAAPHVCIPGPIDTALFKRARAKNKRGMVWVGRLEAHKGIKFAIAYAMENKERLQVYGDGPMAADLPQFAQYVRYHGRVAYDAMPEILGKARTLVHMPAGFDACPRVMLEAYAAGCQIITNGNQGASYWIEEAPEKIETANEDFVKAVQNALR